MDVKSVQELQQLIKGKSNPIMPHLVIGKVTNIDGLEESASGASSYLCEIDIMKTKHFNL